MTQAAADTRHAETVLNVVGLTKSYGGLKAVDDVSLQVFEGEILALVGDNGAGKSTLVKAIAGAQPPDLGRIEIDGVSHQLNSPREASEAGIGCLHQGLGLVDTLNVPENVFLGRELLTRLLPFVSQLDHRRMRERTIELLSGFGISPAQAQRPRHQAVRWATPNRGDQSVAPPGGAVGHHGRAHGSPRGRGGPTCAGACENHA